MDKKTTIQISYHPEEELNRRKTNTSDSCEDVIRGLLEWTEDLNDELEEELRNIGKGSCQRRCFYS